MPGHVAARLYVAGELVAETWIPAGTTGPDMAERVGRLYVAQVQVAEAAGQVWMAELYDPQAPPEASHLRFGTDTAGMSDPQGGPLGPHVAAHPYHRWLHQRMDEWDRRN
jgi:hypothetical protein